MNAAELSPPPPHLAVLLDAKRGQAYAAAFRYKDGRYVGFIDTCLADPRHVVNRCPKPLWLLGEGIDYHRASINTPRVSILPKDLWRARAENVHRVGLEMASRGEFTDPRSLVPIYIRPPEAEEIWERRLADPAGGHQSGP